MFEFLKIYFHVYDAYRWNFLSSFHEIISGGWNLAPFFNLWLRLKRTVSRRRWTWKHKAIEWQVSRQMLWAIPWRFVLLCAWARSFASLLIYACAYAFALTWSCVCKWWTINLSGEREWGDLGYFLRLVCCSFPPPLGCAFFYNGHNLCKNIFDIKITIVQSTCSMFSPWLPLYRIDRQTDRQTDMFVYLESYTIKIHRL